MLWVPAHVLFAEGVDSKRDAKSKQAEDESGHEAHHATFESTCSTMQVSLLVALRIWRVLNNVMRLSWADPGVLWKKAPRAIRAMRGKTLQTVLFKGISTVLWVHQKLPQSTVSQAFPSNKSYESRAGSNRTPATVLWVPLISGQHSLFSVHKLFPQGFLEFSYGFSLQRERDFAAKRGNSPTKSRWQKKTRKRLIRIKLK